MISSMQTKKNLPIAIVVIGFALAAGAAFFLRRGQADNVKQPTSSAPVATPGGGHIKGKADAKVTLVEYGDLQCPSCALYHPMVSELLEGSPDLVKLEFHHFPLVQIHKNAFPAALAAEAAAEQGRFWEMVDLLFGAQKEWSNKPTPQAEEDFLVMAQKLGLDSNRFMQSMRAPETRDRVMADVNRGLAAQVQGTPSFFVNGRPIDLPETVQRFKQAVEEGVASK
jgi:protein-disulfide isomerase